MQIDGRNLNFPEVLNLFRRSATERNETAVLKFGKALIKYAVNLEVRLFAAEGVCEAASIRTDLPDPVWKAVERWRALNAPEETK